MVATAAAQLYNEKTALDDESPNRHDHVPIKLYL
jgi:hypothetical protein